MVEISYSEWNDTNKVSKIGFPQAEISQLLDEGVINQLLVTQFRRHNELMVFKKVECYAFLSWQNVLNVS